MEDFAKELTNTLYGNPHSGSWSSQLSTMRIDDIRLRLLSFFNADPAEYDLVFVANTTAGVKLVVEAMRSLPDGYNYAYHDACHTSIIGVREEAKQSVSLGDDGVESWLGGNQVFEESSKPPSATLFAYSAQSHMDGKRYPLSWSKEMKDGCINPSSPLFTLLDIASYCSTSPVDLSSPEYAADFTVLSLYKIFGFPDLGALIVRRSAEHIFDRRSYFGGGTVDLVITGKEQWHARKSVFLHERLEDGSLPFHNIMALDVAMTVHKKLFGSMERASAHTSYLTQRLFEGLQELRHGNGQPVCVMYTQSPSSNPCLRSGPVVSFNFRNSAGGWISLAEVDKLAITKKVHIRTGGLCSPGKVASALGLEPWEMKRNLSSGARCGADSEIMGGKPTGVIRASLAAMSTMSDVDAFVDFVREFFLDDEPALPISPVSEMDDTFSSSPMRVKSITVYPIKSCGGYVVPPGVSWEVRPEGLAWDREWCLVHPGSGQALSQKRYSQMTLLQTELDFEKGTLRVKYNGAVDDTSLPTHIEIPLSSNPALFDHPSKQMASRVCGEPISAQAYASEEINSFFSRVLGVPCVLARFPAGGRGLSGRTVKARIQKHQQVDRRRQLPGSFPGIPTPPDSDTEQQPEGKILLANESPILLVNAASVQALSTEVLAKGGDAIPDATFRGNIVIEPVGVRDDGANPAYSEDSWSKLRIGDQEFQLLGACRRCQMICVDQKTGEKRQEPFSTLAKTRRFDGKVFFGSHMRHSPRPGGDSLLNQAPMICVGEPVTVEEWIS